MRVKERKKKSEKDEKEERRKEKGKERKIKEKSQKQGKMQGRERKPEELKFGKSQKLKKSQKRKNRERAIKRFDPVLKEIFSNSVESISEIIGVKPKGKPKEISGELKLPKVMRPDILMEFQNFILHIEIQNSHRERIPQRMLLYFIGIQNLQRKEIEKGLRKEKKKVVQVVVWLGKGKPPPSEYKEDDTLIHRYEVIDMNEISPDFFLRSRNPNNILLAVISGKKKGKQEIVGKVIEKLRKVVGSEDELLKYFESLESLGELYDFDVEEVEGMERIYIDIRKLRSYKLGFEEGLEKGIEKGRAEGIKKGEIKGLLKGERKGKIEGLKEAILLDVQIKFGRDKVGFVRNRIRSIDSIRVLRRIKADVLKASSWRDFLNSIQDSNHREKSKNSEKRR